jgi:hypothetical protein
VELAAVALMNVRCLGNSRRHLLSRSFSAFDPTETLAVHYGNVFEVGFSPIKVRQDIDNHHMVMRLPRDAGIQVLKKP